MIDGGDGEEVVDDDRYDDHHLYEIFHYPCYRGLSSGNRTSCAGEKSDERIGWRRMVMVQMGKTIGERTVVVVGAGGDVVAVVSRGNGVVP